ncbi:hypothetical protein [Burkholderia pseudomallei]|uniref:hypothetical protein n=2 Tax=Burkholderia pseudomallei TaxID=28450 RepID=UPI0005320E13|nr:hypothetical protein [Burkholderia pseudomallei]KGS21092.1 hypothetical protein X989_3616 [Burkholderia pseudomallei MSHR4378]KGS26957.1 hypothetical protein X941_927 [Burkholderia pseudomallei MSHR5569]MBM5667794.1 hypothetical protein [Burkholderia pseudomallei]OMY94229.1 hypothetical protein AQ855_20770 [Burkholderia pseudomallei]OMZ03876.1 hypothetical protein AQ854_21100 [Burkholderia pseudomallei]
MTDLIHDFAKIEVPRDLLDQINIDEVLSEFKARFHRLGDLKRARNEHERRSWLMRKWYQNEIEGAQLDAQELQAEFAKSLAQLMVISLLQSQRLEQQQRQIGLQQDQIAAQTREIEQQTKEVSAQQCELAKQATELRNLIDKYFELRGLTQEGAKKLIAIADDVNSTRDVMLSHFASCIDAMRTEQASMREAVADDVAQVSAAQANATSRVEAQTSALAARLDEHDSRSRAIAATLAEITAREQVVTSGLRAHEARAAVHETSTTRLEAMLMQTVNDTSALRGDIGELRGQAEATDVKISAIADRATRRARWSTAVAAIAILISVGALVMQWVH